MKKDKILIEIPRTVRKGNGSLTIALPKETYRLLELEDKQEIKIIIYKNGEIKIQKGDK